MAYFLDDNGYYRNKKTGKLLHRELYFSHFPWDNEEWVIHHVNGIKTDNRMSNLILLPPEFHNELHAKNGFYVLPRMKLIRRWLRDGKIPDQRPNARRSPLYHNCRPYEQAE